MTEDEAARAVRSLLATRTQVARALAASRDTLASVRAAVHARTARAAATPCTRTNDHDPAARKTAQFSS